MRTDTQTYTHTSLMSANVAHAGWWLCPFHKANLEKPQPGPPHAQSMPERFVYLQSTIYIQMLQLPPRIT